MDEIQECMGNQQVPNPMSRFTGRKFVDVGRFQLKFKVQRHAANSLPAFLDVVTAGIYRCVKPTLTRYSASSQSLDHGSRARTGLEDGQRSIRERLHEHPPDMLAERAIIDASLGRQVTRK